MQTAMVYIKVAAYEQFTYLLLLLVPFLLCHPSPQFCLGNLGLLLSHHVLWALACHPYICMHHSVVSVQHCESCSL